MGGPKNPEYYVIRGSSQWAAPNISGNSFDDVKKKLTSINSEPVGTAAATYKDAAEALAEMTIELRGFAQTLVKHWKGDEAQKALDQLEQVQTTAVGLSNRSHETATVYTWYKTKILDWYKQAGKDADDGWFHTGSDDKAARELLQRFVNRTGEAYNAHPAQIDKDLPTSSRGGFGDTPPGGTGGIPPGGGIPGGGPGGIPGGGGGIPGGGPGGFGGVKGAGFGADGGGLPHGGAGSPSDPFGNYKNDGPHLNPGEPGSGSFPGSGGSGSGGPGSFPGGSHGVPGSGVPGHGVPGHGAPGHGGSVPHGGPGPFDGSNGKTELSGLPGGGGAGLGGGPGGGAGGFGADPGGLGGGSGGLGAGPGGLGSAGGMGAGSGAGAGGMASRASMPGAGGMPMGGMPMAPGGHGGQDKQPRTRETWLSEEENIWGADDEHAPPVVGHMPDNGSV
ncbi:WXG100 family type VII secretion target [Actinomadura roseirufa]|uniref:WXG100 family type VII secretion target n=1 Tax=Actinomadura roseirufa TaxID=2094049 RepID=UPI001040FE75|nr:hypothetical protein [Actinomadura roseirufa]